MTPRKGGDDIFEVWPPESYRHFGVLLPPNHASGTFWYHPHHHHSTADQAGGGLHGALIVEDPPGVVPPEVEKMPEKVMVSILSLCDCSQIICNLSKELKRQKIQSNQGPKL